MYSINVIIICYYCWSLLLMLELCQGDETTDADVRIAPIILILSLSTIGSYWYTNLKLSKIQI